MEPNVSYFKNLRGGYSMAVLDNLGQTTAYVDANPNGYECTLFDPSNGHSRTYKRKTLDAIERLVNGNLYVMGLAAISINAEKLGK